MKGRLSGYRDAMDRSVFKDEKFTSRHKQEVLAGIKKRRKKRSDWLPRTLSAAFGILLLLIGGYFLVEVTSNSVDQAESLPEIEPAFSGNDSTPLPAEEETEEPEVTKEEKLAELAAPYNEIGHYLADWELPEEGLLPIGEEVENMEPSTETLAAYENGYGFSREDGVLVLRSYGVNGESPVPTGDQFPGVFMGFIGDLLYSASTESEGNEETPPDEQEVQAMVDDTASTKLPRLKELQEYSDGNEPLDAWLEETIRLFEEAAAGNDGVRVKELYEEGTARVAQMQETIEIARE